MILWTTNTWGAAHQNAAVFMRNLGPLVRAPRRVMRRKRRAVVIHTVCGATAKDGVVQPLDLALPPLPSLLTHLSLLQGQCSTKFLSPPPFLCLSVYLTLNVFLWLLGDKIHGLVILQFPLSSPLPDRDKERRVDRDAEILICCYSRTQASGFFQLSFLPPPPAPIPILLFPGIQGSWSQSLPFVLIAKRPVLGSSYLCPLHSILESQTQLLGFQQR